MLIIALGHRSGVGKDTFAKMLQEEFVSRGHHAEITHFATPIKELSHDLFGWAGVRPPAHYDESRADRPLVLKRLGMSALDLWIRLGQTMRELHPDVWVWSALGQERQCDILLIPDCRFLNEVAAVWQRLGVVVKIESSHAPILDSVSDNALEGFCDWDYVIQNDGTIAELRQKASRFAVWMEQHPLMVEMKERKQYERN